MGGRLRVEIAPTGVASLKAIRVRKTLREIGKAIEGLSTRPEAQGKPLQPPLETLRSLRAARDRYRILYRVRRNVVQIVLVGERLPGRKEDVYLLAQKLLSALLKEKE
jgi:mRNA interferase RelE/StbE